MGMKKWLAMLMACVLMLTMVPAMAEDAVEETAPQDIVPLQDQLDKIFAEYPNVDRQLGGENLAGTWYPIGMYYKILFVDEQGFFPIVASINEDGTGSLDDWRNEESYECTVVLGTYVNKTNIMVNMYDRETGVFLDAFMVDRDARNNDNYWILKCYQDQAMGVLHNAEGDGLYAPPIELAPVAADNSIEAILNLSAIWQLSDTNLPTRKVMYDELEMGALVTKRGNMLRFYSDPESGVVQVEFFRAYGVNFAGFVDGVTEDGAIRITMSNAEESYVESAVIRLHEDGKLTMEIEELGNTFIFDMCTIDPLTEYTDKETTKAVQTAMNAEGFACGTPDGVAGKKTAAAITGYQQANGLTQTGTITYELLQSLRAKGHDL